MGPLNPQERTCARGACRMALCAATGREQLQQDALTEFPLIQRSCSDSSCCRSRRAIRDHHDGGQNQSDGLQRHVARSVACDTIGIEHGNQYSSTSVATMNADRPTAAITRCLNTKIPSAMITIEVTIS